MTNAQEYFKEIFDYDDGKLFWRKKIAPNTKVGAEAGYVIPNGRRYVGVNGKRWLVHRVIWIMHYGECPEYLDHIDRDPSNNRIENLRAATKQQNSWNRSIRSDNKTGIKGIWKQGDKFRASICVDGKNKYLGIFSSKLEAKAAYEEAARLHFGGFAHVN